MSGFIAGGIVSLILTTIGVVAIIYSRTISGLASVSIIQAAMLVKLMLASTFTLALIKLAPFEINLWAYALTLGTYSCVGFPVIAYYTIKKDFGK